MTDQHSPMSIDTADSAADSAPAKPRVPWYRGETMRTIVTAVMLALVFRSFFFEPFHIPSSSMKSTLLIGDYIFVSKASYGYSRYSFPLGLPLFEGRIGSSDRPKRGDVVVFRPPAMPRVDFIKRVIGLPGDRIQVINGELYINGVACKREAMDDFTDYLEDGTGTITKVRRYKETLPEGKTHEMLDLTQFGNVDNTQVYTVPDKHYFMMGDNRDNSTDSRYLNEIGFIPEENIIGRADRIFFSKNDQVKFWQLWAWFTDGRTTRFFKSID